MSSVRCYVFRKATHTYTDKELHYFIKLCNDKHKLVMVEVRVSDCDEMKNNNINVSSTTIHIKGPNFGLCCLCNHAMKHRTPQVFVLIMLRSMYTIQKFYTSQNYLILIYWIS